MGKRSKGSGIVKKSMMELTSIVIVMAFSRKLASSDHFELLVHLLLFNERHGGESSVHTMLSRFFEALWNAVVSRQCLYMHVHDRLQIRAHNKHTGFIATGARLWG